MRGNPLPGASPLEWARRIAVRYRAIAAEPDAERRRQLLADADQECQRYGQHWVTGRVRTYGEEERLTPAQASELAMISVDRLSELARAGRLERRWDGKAWCYRAGDIYGLSTETRTRRRSG